MFFVLSKVLSIFLSVHLHSYFCLLAAGLLALTKFIRLAKIALTLAVVLPLFYGFTWTGYKLLGSLENFAPTPSATELIDVKGIIVLAGFTGRPQVSKERNEAQINGQGERFLKAVELARLYPNKPVWFAGYSGQLFPKGWSEDEITKKLIIQLGLQTERFSFETSSRNTYESAKNMHGLITPDANEKWVLVTSASHMKRAVASFKAAGLTTVIPYPVDFITRPSKPRSLFSLSAGPNLLKIALHEYIGYLAYWLSGRI